MSVQENDGDEKSSTSGDVVHGELENQDEVKRLSLNSSFLWGLGVSIVIGGEYIGWNEILQSGFGSALISTVWITSGYVCLVFCMAEVSSAIPFGGGSYGIARVTLGFFPGYMVAFMESSQNVIFVASGAVSFGEIITTITRQSANYEPLYWIFFYISSLALQICGGRTFWYFIMFMAVLSIIILLIYIFGSAPEFNFSKNALITENEGAHQWFKGGMVEFMRVMPVNCWFYMGIESINLACKDVPNPRVQVPRGYLSSLITLVSLAFAILFCVTSVTPGIETIMYDLNPLKHHFQHILHFPPELASFIIVPSIYAMCSGFMYCYGKQLRAMARSGLIHPYFARNYKGYKMPVYTLLWGSLVSFCIALADYFINALTDRHLFVLCMMCAFTAYFSQFVSFIIFRYKFATIKREFVSPLGIAGAVHGFIVFATAFVGAVGFQKDFIAVSLFAALVVLVVAYYFWAAQDRQSFSEEEKQVMFRAYLMKSNDHRNKRIKKGKVGVAINSSHSNVSNNSTSISMNRLSPHSPHTPHSPKRFAGVSLVSASASSVESPRTALEARDHFHVSNFGLTQQKYSPRQLSPRTSQASSQMTAFVQDVAQSPASYTPLSNKSAGSQRVKLVVHAGSSFITMTGQIAPEDFPTLLDGVLQNNDDIVLLDEEQDLDEAATEQRNEAERREEGGEVDAQEAGVEIATMTQDLLLSNSDMVYYNNSNHEHSVQFSDVEHLDV